MNNDVLRQWVNMLSIVALVVMNILANALPLNGQNTGEISDRFQVFFVPAGYVFAIWFLIYVGLIAFGIYQALPAQKENARLRRIGYIFALSCLANISWLFFWHYEQFPLSLLAMLVLLVCLVVVYLRLGIGQTVVSTREKWLVDIPFSIYLGWITVATIANVTDVLYYLGWSGWGLSPQAWAVVMLAAAVIITGAMILTRGDTAYALVIIWAAAGIGVKQADSALVSGAAWAAVVVVALLLVWNWFSRRRAAGQPLPAG
ncbi:MAG: tryptophan-rich sensory protein [Anaerolineales bacterium]|jgi:hypothetical protein